MHYRIWTSDKKEVRELLEVGRNGYGDILLTLDSGEIWQFTPHQIMRETPTAARVEQVGRGRDSVTKLETEIAFLILRDPPQTFTGNLRIMPADTREPSHADLLAAVQVEGEATRRTFGETLRGLLEKVGFVPKRQRFPRVSAKAQTRVSAMWRAWQGTRLDAQAGPEKVDCFDHYRSELRTFKIESVEHFKAVLDAARK